MGKLDLMLTKQQLDLLLAIVQDASATSIIRIGAFVPVGLAFQAAAALCGSMKEGELLVVIPAKERDAAPPDAPKALGIKASNQK